MHTPAQVSALCRELQEINAEVSDTPLLISIDQEGGMVMRIEQGVTPIPAAMAFQAAGSPVDCERMNQISGDEMRQVGINMLLAPVLDVNNNRNNPVIGVRAYGEDADTVIEYGMAAMRGQRASGLAVTAKHFPGHGDTAIDTHYAMALVPHDKERLRAVELAPFRAAIAGGVDAIMTAHVVFPPSRPIPSVPATLSKGVLTDLLRGEMGYQGVVITDCGNGGHRRRHRHSQGAIATLQAGADILISHRQAQQTAAIDAVIAAVESGEIAMERIDAALARVAELKRNRAVRDGASAPSRRRR
jgi:beta-N-acetylhexosaminidase